jgi:hypothetical protein
LALSGLRNQGQSKNPVDFPALILLIAQEETREYECRETLARSEHYQETGETLNDEVMEAWLDTWGSDQENPEAGKSVGDQMAFRDLVIPFDSGNY